MNAHEKALLAMKTAGLWSGSFNGRESSLQQLSPYVGKLKSGIVRLMINYFTEPGEWVCDPFSGAGVVPLEALLMGRKAAANDINPYAYCLTRGKLEAPATYEDAERRTLQMLKYVMRHWSNHDLRTVDDWVRTFFHPKTLKETLAAFEYCQKKGEWFLAASLCGILHHQRPGFLSYPASHIVPYLRTLLLLTSHDDGSLDCLHDLLAELTITRCEAVRVAPPAMWPRWSPQNRPTGGSGLLRICSLIGEDPGNDLLAVGIAIFAYADFQRFADFGCPKRYYDHYAHGDRLAAFDVRVIAIPCRAYTPSFFHAVLR
jgi:hypothetical protein